MVGSREKQGGREREKRTIAAGTIELERCVERQRLLCQHVHVQQLHGGRAAAASHQRRHDAATGLRGRPELVAAAVEGITPALGGLMIHRQPFLRPHHHRLVRHDEERQPAAAAAAAEAATAAPPAARHSQPP